jgi:hypothetical protein
MERCLRKKAEGTSDGFLRAALPLTAVSRYCFAEGGAGAYGGKGKAFFGLPLAYAFGGGGGADIFYAGGGSIYFETGYLGYMLGSTYAGGPIFQIGWRGYF